MLSEGMEHVGFIESELNRLVLMKGLNCKSYNKNTELRNKLGNIRKLLDEEDSNERD